MTNAPAISRHELPRLLRGELECSGNWLRDWSNARLLLALTVIVAGAGLYGAAMGCWRSPTQAVYTAIKFPLVILLTTVSNALLNAFVAPQLGLNLSIRQSFIAVLMSFVIASAILGAFSPVIFFLVWNTPAMSDSAANSQVTHSFILLTHVIAIAFAGVAANARLLQFLRALSGNPAIATRVLFAWMAGNLFLGSQLSWILRPFIGAPHLEVEFLRPNAFQWNFYEIVFQAIRHLITQR